VSWNELEMIAALRRALSGGVPPGETHVGDDAAVLGPPPGKLLLAADALVEGVHFDLSFGGASDAGWKALSVNVSDIAAMGGEATYAVSSVAAPAGSDLEGLFAGLLEASRHYSVTLVGGDLSLAAQLFISVAVIGGTDALPAVRRSGARPGDELWCTGPLGASAAGLALLKRGGDGDGSLAAAYLRPEARPAEGRLAARLGARAMIDVSDGLSSDLDHLATESGVGVILETLPVHPGASEEDALGGGEDYELVFAMGDGTDVCGDFREAGLREPVRIGRVVEDASVRMLGDRPLRPTGWVHGSARGS
jgi:thiamine-monophosphate kinase